MKATNLHKHMSAVVMICVTLLTLQVNSFGAPPKGVKNTPTHAVSIADIVNQNEMPREMRSSQGNNSLRVADFNFTAGNDGKYSLAFKLEKDAPTYIRIVDVGGYDSYFETFKDGIAYNKQIDLTSLPAGTYYFQVTQKGKTFTKKLIFS
jgi:hypothetical protein